MATKRNYDRVNKKSVKPKSYQDYLQDSGIIVEHDLWSNGNRIYRKKEIDKLAFIKSKIKKHV